MVELGFVIGHAPLTRVQSAMLHVDKLDVISDISGEESLRRGLLER
jgi:hypothetical protein